jgi:ABC-type histidine transport system ATPase subunit
MKLGRPAYEHIRESVESGNFTTNQLRNALHALFRLRDHATWQEVFDIFVRLAGHENKAVRTEAVTLAVGCLRFQKLYPLQPLSATNQDIAAIRRSLAMGVERKTAELAKEVLAL